MKEYSRADRVGVQIRSEISQALLHEVRDPRVQNISIMAIQVSDSLEFVKIFWFPLDAEQFSERDQKRTQRGLEQVTPFLRRRIAQNLSLRIVPELRFIYDLAVERGRNMDEMLRRVRQEDAEMYPELVADPTILADVPEPSDDDDE